MNFYSYFLGLICSVFNAYSGVLFFKDKGDLYKLVGAFSLGEDVFVDHIKESGKGVVGWIIKNEKPLLINNFERRSQSILEYYSNRNGQGIKSFMGCPLKDKLGVLCVDSKNKFSFTEKDQKILFQFSQVISDLHKKFAGHEKLKMEYGFYRCIQIVDRLRRNYQKWDEFLKKFLNIISKTTNFKYCFMVGRDEDGKGYYIEDSSLPFLPDNFLNKKFSMDVGIIGWIFKKGKPLINEKFNAKSKDSALLFDRSVKITQFKSLVCLPLVIYFKVRGVLVLADDNKHVVSEEMRQFLFLVADYLSLFLENLYLKNKLKKFLKPSQTKEGV